MKNIRRVTALALAFILLVLSLPAISVRAAEGDLRYGRTKLNAGQQYIYDALASGCEAAKAEIKIDLSGKNIDFDKDLGTAYTMFYSDYPEYFWLTGSWGASFDGVTLTMKPEYYIPGGDLSAARSKYNQKVQEMTSGLKGSDYDKAKTIHDRLVDKVSYASSKNDQNAYGALVEGKAVCNGYARAYQHLMNKAGIPAWYVRGVSANPSTGASIGHAWNLVKIDGDWYYTDVTWDDQDGNTFYAYFNITTKQLLKGHTIDSDYADLVPKATATEANFYKKENRIFTSYDETRFVNLLKQDGNKTQIYVDGDVDAFVADVNTNLVSIGQKLNGPGGFQISYSMFELGNALIFDVVLTSANHVHKTKTSVKLVKESCLANGTKAHYICDCGAKFLDEACTKQVVSDSELTIPASSHSPSGYKNDGADHWKECKKCGSEIAKSRSAHKDGNKDNKCDACAYVMAVYEQGGGSSAGGNTTPNNGGDTNGGGTNSGTGSSGGNQGSSNSTVPESTKAPENPTASPEATQESTSETTAETVSGEIENTFGQETNADPQKPDVQEQDRPGNPVILICVVIAVVVVATATVTLIVKKKK